MIKSNYGLRSKASTAPALHKNVPEPTRTPSKKLIQGKGKAKVQPNPAAPPSPPSSNGADDQMLVPVDAFAAPNTSHRNKETYYQKGGAATHDPYGDEKSYPSPPPLASPSIAVPEPRSRIHFKQLTNLTIKTGSTKRSLSGNLTPLPRVIIERPTAKSLIVRIRVQRELLPQNPLAAAVKANIPPNGKKRKAQAESEDGVEPESRQRYKKPAASPNKRQKTQAKIEEDEKVKSNTVRATLLTGATKIHKKVAATSQKAKAPAPAPAAQPAIQAVAPAQLKKSPPAKGLTSRQMRSIASNAYLTTKPNSMRVGKGMTLVTKKRKRVLVIDVPEPQPDPQPEPSPTKGPKHKKK